MPQITSMNIFARLLPVALFSALVAFSSAALAQEAPDVTIKRVVDEVTSAIKADKDIQGGNRAKINALVETKIAPVVNFQRMTQSAMGRHWAATSPAQKEALVKEFKGLLINTYAGALSAYKPETVVEYRPLRIAAGDTDAVVRSLVKGASAEPIQLDYYLEKDGSAWKVIDINILGARLVETYRNQFNSEVGNNGVDGLIKALASRNRQLEARRS
jgi:phospholipid transport system substrate-binding protein